MRTKAYIGDSVYAEFDGHAAVILTTENGCGPTNTIVLGLRELETLGEWVDAVLAHHIAGGKFQKDPCSS